MDDTATFNDAPTPGVPKPEKPRKPKEPKEKTDKQILEAVLWLVQSQHISTFGFTISLQQKYLKGFQAHSTLHSAEFHKNL